MRALENSDARALLTELYYSAVRAAAPGPAVEAALTANRGGNERPWIIALGKAAHPMASAAVRFLERAGLEPAGGIIVAPAEESLNQVSASTSRSPHPNITISTGDHPEPGGRSLMAGAKIGEVARLARKGKEVWVLLSGGATSLSAAPVDNVSPRDLTALFATLLGSGLDISVMNTVRKRFSRWGAGRLAASLYPARVRVLVVSDVIGDDLSAIGSGPCVPDDSTAAQVRKILVDRGLWQQTPETVRVELERTERDSSLETPKAGDPCFRSVESAIIANNKTALDGAGERAREFGFHTVIHTVPLCGTAATAGAFVLDLFGDHANSASQRAPLCLIAGGETVVKLQSADPAARDVDYVVPPGGRCQELALAAARVLGAMPGNTSALLAAGTDGRDGPTDAAGAIVDGTTWERIKSAGRVPEEDLARHNSYSALNSAGALLRTGLTGTNVADIVIAAQM
ncbi:MAG: DUF4147 domain-containing protein [Anaerolineae bacterium]|nr:DUF4147 domain-containing protein [Gemmatimonadaceae bacterium]